MNNTKFANDVNVIWLTKGIPASGKTAWAKKKVWETDRTKRVSKDDMRSMLDNSQFSMKNEGFILQMRNELVEGALLQGYNVVIDDTNFRDDHFRAMCDIARRVGHVRVVEVFFPIKLKEALRRNEKRPESERVPEHVIENMFKRHVKDKKVKTRDEYFMPAVTHGGGEDAIIVGMDGTLCLNNSGRGYYEWDRVIEDDPNMPVVSVVKSMKQQGYKIVVVTGREEVCKQQCKDWLFSFGIPFDALLTREKGDNRKDAEVKQELYDDHIQYKYNIKFALDDRMSIVNKWRSMGIPTFQVTKGLY